MLNVCALFSVVLDYLTILVTVIKSYAISNIRIRYESNI